MEIDNTSMVVLLNVLMHWWEADNLPHPGASMIATRMGVDKRTVERSLKKLQKKGIIVRLAKEQDHRGQSIRRIDPSNLVRRLENYAM
ncbi:MAG: DNA-binding MarR family transcriptional regulator [Arenicella sp.]|jgi:DNA-binding MarR family transcriptional regulator